MCFDDAALRERSLDPAATGVYLAQQPWPARTCGASSGRP